MGWTWAGFYVVIFTASDKKPAIILVGSGFVGRLVITDISQTFVGPHMVGIMGQRYYL